MSDPVVVDSSLATKWVLNEPGTAIARQLLLGWVRQTTTRLAPCWFAAEIAVALYKRMRWGDITSDEVDRALRDILATVTLRTESASITVRAIEIAAMLGQGRPYDSMYLALAEREGCELWTADQRFYNAVRARFPQVRWLGTYPGA
ncbi:MAG TPA: type II toxin-antitoxin system VapC family toxin [Casimicrobiaceae bacterium]